MRTPLLQTKIKQNRGLGEQGDYKPFIKAREFNSQGTCSNVVDWKHGRQMQLLSQVEYGIYMQERWRDDVDDIREHFPLNMEQVKQIYTMTNEKLIETNQNPFTFRINDEYPITTNMLLTLNNGKYEAINIQYNKNRLSKTQIERLWIEKRYWEEKDIKFRVLDKKDINSILVQNIRIVTEFYDINKVFDKTSAIKHLIATKQLHVDMEHKILNFNLYINLLNNGGFLNE